MKNRKLYQQLEKQYTKFKNRLQKAVDSGRFAAYSAFKQQQWLHRLRRYRTQMQRLGAGVAVVAALSVGNEVQAQTSPEYVFTEVTGAISNPFHTYSGNVSRVVFVDLDGDLDDDVVVERIEQYNNQTARYYENTGSTTNPVYTERTGANNPLTSTGFASARGYVFVDIDGDNDLDVFATNPGEDPYNYSTTIFYAENTGSTGVPAFTNRTTTTQNVLRGAETYINGLSLSSDRSALLSFVDVDGDTDLDCMIGVSSYGSWPGGVSNSDKILYYKNMGSGATPQFQKETAANNPLDGVATTAPSNSSILAPITFEDFDRDGDEEALVYVSTNRVPYYLQNNSGSYTVAVDTFIESIVTDQNIVIGTPAWTDANGDGRLDVFAIDGFGSNASIRYFRTTSIVVGTNEIPDPTRLALYPNPVKDLVYWEEPLSGTAHLYNTLGQEVQTTELVDAQQLQLGALQTGTYFLEIRTEDKHYQQTLVVE